MSENYVECLVKRESSLSAKLLKYVLLFFAVACLLLTVAGYVLPFFIGVAAAVAAYLVHLNLNIEFEYLYLDKEISVDRIQAKSKRKRVAVYELERIEILAPINSHHLDSYRRRQGKVVDYSVKKQEQPDLRYMMFYDGNQKILLNPSEEMLQAIHTVAPRKVFID